MPPLRRSSRPRLGSRGAALAGKLMAKRPVPAAGALALFMPGGGDGREFDLPPKWDGRAVAWQPWSTTSTPAGEGEYGTPCPHCGSFENALITQGVGEDDPTDYIIVTVPSVGPDGVGTVERRQRVRPQLVLTVTRCPECLHDTVRDPLTGTCDLDEGDYGPDGSWCTDAEYAELDPIDRWDGRPADMGLDEDGNVPTSWV